jgi:NAD(P)H-flavin reductase
MTIDGYDTVSAPIKRERYVSNPKQKDANMFKIVKRITLSTNPEIIEFQCYSPNVAAHCKPGQFVIVRANEKAERIPLTIADYDS